MEAKSEEQWINATKKKQPAWCYYDNSEMNGKKYGRLYNFYAVIDKRGLAPIGWRIPSELDYKEIINFLGGENEAGTKMKKVTGWKLGKYRDSEYGGTNANGDNSSGFSCLPGGTISVGMHFHSKGEYCGLWTSSLKIETKCLMVCLIDYKDGYFWVENKSNIALEESLLDDGNYVRCVKE